MKVKKMLAAVAVLAAPAVFAHSGHDHEAVTSGLIHSVALLSIMGAAFVAYKVLTAKKAAKQLAKQDITK